MSTKPIASASCSITPLGPRADQITSRSDDTRSGYGGSDRHTLRERRREADSRHEVMDGSYGFQERMDTDDNYEGGLYSDDLVGKRGSGDGRGNDRGRGYR